jgi:hypothetical protein
MPMCPVCDSYNAEGVEICAACSSPMSSDPVSPAAAGAGSAPLAHRPNGTPLMVGGWVGVAIGAALGFWGHAVRGPAAAIGDSAGLDWSNQLLALAATLLWVGFAALLTGCIIRAIWFLPGSETKARSAGGL